MEGETLLTAKIMGEEIKKIIERPCTFPQLFTLFLTYQTPAQVDTGWSYIYKLHEVNKLNKAVRMMEL